MKQTKAARTVSEQQALLRRDVLAIAGQATNHRADTRVAMHPIPQPKKATGRSHFISFVSLWLGGENSTLSTAPVAPFSPIPAPHILEATYSRTCAQPRPPIQRQQFYDEDTKTRRLTRPGSLTRQPSAQYPTKARSYAPVHVSAYPCNEFFRPTPDPTPSPSSTHCTKPDQGSLHP